ncbi:hypothetical protein pEaSNUABM56_00249 [Erwinia phage pEa_SNUABM_56]|uniref:Uncharacterized protein n=1 Tax=Erwinia phage pEp_SNUABM_01 TaxID=2601643 RepID=A0A5J6DAX6_9CAUD|nr:hypothetical protein HWC63_gp154 [Erwinia phage pEp_SNUABM_01]QEQ95024.1 hypothetical protein pEpSNUABM01_198 [Erwinia phage pEp_SNUABM_01]UYL84951.1 hypothetical protein pEaSNUABM55_00178 [Erwinia phage pEa_SNUABM_55]UYL85269.1 hypothetical protein pEaSNUABM56_00249 [Erwinia phage pEa_SNUABM_56]
MTYSVYGRMSLDACSLQGEWYFLKGSLTASEAEVKVEHYKKTWRYVEIREENRE